MSTSQGNLCCYAIIIFNDQVMIPLFLILLEQMWYFTGSLYKLVGSSVLFFSVTLMSRFAKGNPLLYLPIINRDGQCIQTIN